MTATVPLADLTKQTQTYLVNQCVKREIQACELNC